MPVTRRRRLVSGRNQETAAASSSAKCQEGTPGDGPAAGRCAGVHPSAASQQSERAAMDYRVPTGPRPEVDSNVQSSDIVTVTQRRSCIWAQGWGFEGTRPTFSWAWPRRTPSRGRWRPVVGGQRKSRPSAAARWPACCQNVDTGAEQPPLPRPGLQPALASAAGHPRRVARVQGANRLKSGTIVLMTRATKTVLTNRCVMRKIMNGWILAVVGNSSRCCQRFNMSASSSCVSRVGDVRRTHTYACICRH